MNSFGLLFAYRRAFAEGLFVTGQLVLLSCIAGSIFGTCLEFAASLAGPLVRRLLDAIAFCLAAIPALVILFWIHFPLQSLLDVVVRPFYTALVTLSLLNTFFIYRIVADAVGEFPTQYLVAARVCGLDLRTTFIKVKAPILLRTIMPRWIDQQVAILHTSLFASFISVEETFRVAQRVNSQLYRPVLIYTAIAILFLSTTGPVLLLSRRLRTAAFRDFSER